MVTFFYMRWMETIQNVTMQPSIWGWLLSGTLMGLGLVVPGMSPSNFLIYLGLYQPMASGIRQLDLSVIIPIGVGCGAVHSDLRQAGPPGRSKKPTR